MISLDHTDISILKLLQKDAKMTNKEIAAAMGLTTTPVYERIKKMEKAGVIQGYAAIVDHKQVAQSMIAYCNVSLKEHSQAFIETFERQVRQLREVMECHHIAGASDYLLKIVVKDMEVYREFMTNKLATIENIGRVQSSFVMKEIKHEIGLNL
ncbi:MAG: Lrp/AsnC family transcriptional regulator [Flammeovirgaceae bacterium]